MNKSLAFVLLVSPFLVIWYCYNDFTTFTAEKERARSQYEECVKNTYDRCMEKIINDPNSHERWPDGACNLETKEKCHK